MIISFPVLVLLPWAFAATRPVTHSSAIHVPIFRRGNVFDRVANLPKIADAMKRKYGITTTNMKRFTSVPLADLQNDVIYTGVVSIGTPAQNFSMFLDTGSSDLWVVTTSCLACQSGTQLFDTSRSSTYTNFTSPLNETYASGIVSGYASEDTVTFGGFTLPRQRLVSVDTFGSFGLVLQVSFSGIMGLGFQSISALQASPFWQTLYDQNMLPQAIFAFYFERHVNQTTNGIVSPGGTFTLGGTNASLYTGNIEFIDMPTGTTPSYWLQQVQTVTIQGTSISVPSENGLAVIDTGSTLIVAPTSVYQEIWSHVPGSLVMTGTYNGFYAFPCNTNVTVSISFGGTNWPINPSDMNFGEIEVPSSPVPMCLGGIIELPEGRLNGTFGPPPSWIIGDAFLKNVYSVFRADPPSVGFARLSSNARTRVGGALSLASLSLIVVLAWLVIMI